jgi:hypothetical protein
LYAGVRSTIHSRTKSVQSQLTVSSLAAALGGGVTKYVTSIAMN